MASNIHTHQHLMGPVLKAGDTRCNLGAHKYLPIDKNL